jgi:hypothetical protein
MLFAAACALILSSALAFSVGVFLLPIQTQRRVGALWFWTSMEIMLLAVVTALGAFWKGVHEWTPPPSGLGHSYPRWFDPAMIFGGPFAVSLALLGIQATVWVSFDLRKLR